MERVKHQILLSRGIGSWSRSIVITIKERHLSFLNMVIKVGISCMAISEPWVWINGQLQSLHNFQQSLAMIQLLLVENALKLNFEAL